MEVVQGGQTLARVVRRGSRWWLDGASGPPWPVLDSRARAAARILADLVGRPLPESADPSDLPPVAASLHVETAGRTRWTLGLREPVVGGLRVIDRVDDAGRVLRYAIDQPLYEAFVSTGMQAWRDPALLAMLPARPSRVTLAQGQARLELASVDGRWAMRQPVATRADESAVGSLLEALARLRVERFDEPPPPAGTDLGQAVRIELEADALEPVQGEPVRTADRLVVTLLGAADTAGRLTLAGAQRVRQRRQAGQPEEDLGTAYVALDAASLQGVSLRPRNFVAPTAIAGDASMIATLTLDGRTYARTSDGWSADGMPVDQAQAHTLSALAVLLAQQPMTGVELTDRPEPIGQVTGPLVVQAHDVAGQPFDRSHGPQAPDRPRRPGPGRADRRRERHARIHRLGEPGHGPAGPGAGPRRRYRRPRYRRPRHGSPRHGCPGTNAPGTGAP
ncbi:MAG: hypothetical protein KatS3mg103_1365 [Phycisphaerales bacterium]|nr:MAG: hypothetical protein KatS3mg103_1365 [Phycisphaerales bacterium]